MRGKRHDAFGPEVQRMALDQAPVNPIVTFGPLLNPMVQARMSVNPKALLVNKRDQAARVFNRAQGDLITLQANSRNEGYGPVKLPDYPGIWGDK